jgi:archaellum component FlaF (FlaF/FlaG flagellin family)
LNVPAGSTTTVVGPDITNRGHRGLTVTVVTTAIGTGSVTLVIEGKDSASNSYWTILSGAAIVTNTTNRYWVFPGATVTANVSANDELPELYRVRLVANNANPVTCSVGGSTLV